MAVTNRCSKRIYLNTLLYVAQAVVHQLNLCLFINMQYNYRLLNGIIILIKGDKCACFTLREDPPFECDATLIGDDASRHHKAHGTYRTRQFPRHLSRKPPLVSVPAALLMLILSAGTNPVFLRLNLTKVVLVGCCHTEILLCQR